MATKSVAVDGDVQAIPGTIPYPGSTGAWSPGGVTVKIYPKLKVGGVEVVYEASCTFSFSGTSTSPPNPPVTGSETVTLTAGSTVVMGGQDNVLVNGDTEVDTYGNQLLVVAMGKLKTA